MAEDSRGLGLAWLLVGLGIGAVVGILYAPKSGRETREDIAVGARDGTEYLRTRTKQAVERVSAAIEAGREAYRTTESSRG